MSRVRAPAGDRPAPPLDLRLVPAALATWACAAVGVLVRPSWAVAAAAALAVLAAAVVVRGWRRGRWRRGHSGSDPSRPGFEGSGRVLPGGRGRDGPRHRGPGAVASALVLAMVAAALCLGVVGAAGHARTTGLWGELVRQAATVEVEAVVLRQPVAYDRYGQPQARAVVEVRTVTGRGLSDDTRAPVLVLGPPAWQHVVVGERVRTTGRLAATKPGEDVVALLIAHADPEVAAAPPLLRGVAGLRAGLVQAVEPLAPDARGLVPGIAVGDTSQLPDDLAAAMRTVSLTHVTAVSGAHVAIVLGTLLGLTAWLRPAPRALLAAAALVGFVLLVHPEPSVLRSAAMGTVTVLGLLLGRPARAMPALAFAVIVLVLLDPWIARSYGFVLSVLATAGLVLLAPGWAAWLSRRLPGPVAHALAIPAAAQAACGPVVILLEPALALYAVPANVLAAVAVPPATVLGVAATLVGGVWPWAAVVLARAAGACATWIALVARWCADLPGAALPWPGGVGGAALLAVTTVAAVVLARAVAAGRSPVVRLVALLASLALALAVLPGPRRVVGGLLPTSWPPEGWVVAMCDVGQGTAVAVRSGPGRAVLVDVGPAGDAAARCLDSLGVRGLDLLVLTHAHDDHVGGLGPVLAGRTVERALVSPYPEPARAWRAVTGELAEAGVAVAAPAADDAAEGASGQAGDVRWDVVWPTARAVAETWGSDGTAVNDTSLAVLLHAPGVTVLALGDLETTAQAQLARAARILRDAPSLGHAASRAAPKAHPGTGAGVSASADPRALVGVDVVLVAHHGSPRQDAGLAAVVGADLALVSVGAENDYGHPAPRTIELYERSGAVVLRTDRCGAVAVLARPLATVSACAGPDGAVTPAGSPEPAAGADARGPLHGGRSRAPRRPAGPPGRSAWQAVGVPPASRRGAPSVPALAWDEVGLAPVVLVRGPETVLAERAVARVLGLARERDPGVEVTTLEAAAYDTGRLALLASPSLFGEQRCIVVAGVESATDALVGDAVAYVAQPAEDVTLVLRHGGGTRGKRLLDAVGAAGFPVVACDPVKRDADKVTFAQQEFRRAGRRADAGAVRALVDAAGNDLAELAAACQQLVSDTAGTVTAEVVHRYHGGRVEATGFAVADAAVGGDGAEAIRLLRHALATGLDPVPLVAVLAMKLRVLAKVAATRGRGAGALRDLGLAPWQVDRARRELGGWTPEGLAAAIAAVAAADAEVKGGGRDPQFAVERAVLRVASAHA